MIWVLCLFEIRREQQHRWSGCFHHERFGWTETACVDGLARKPPALPVCMEVMPVHAEVEIKNVPADALSGMGEDRGRVPNERPTIKTIRRYVVSATFEYAVLARTTVYPGNLSTYSHSDASRRKEEVADCYGGGRRPTSLNNYFAAHGRSVNATHVVIICGYRKHGRCK